MPGRVGPANPEGTKLHEALGWWVCLFTTHRWHIATDGEELFFRCTRCGKEAR